MSMKKTVLAGTLLAAVSVVGGCGTTPEAPAVAASPPGAGNLSGSASAPMPTLSSDYPTFTSVKELAQASQLIVRGKVVSGPKKADEASQVGGNSENDIPSVVYEVAVDKVYKGDAVDRIHVIQPDQTRVTLSEKKTPLTAGRSVLLFLNDPGVTFEGLSVHSTYGNDQGYVSLTGSPTDPKPVGQQESVPLPATLAELEREISGAG
ncbi:hypothetical protein [Mobilicoccus caccae]|uniref:Lipoprotein n=1 Tax=Mobilicoccus caccae TaxID=1859295 RepID=A0ABQ6IX64_9MICO|nr:hypothetical protein [Mobilicoccus caccae]GMA42094.1 hypothetical protein GCM10025883_41390 [Mobilicoccus caccae]